MCNVQGPQLYWLLFIVAVGGLTIGIMIGKRVGWDHAERLFQPFGSKYYKRPRPRFRPPSTHARR